LGGALTNVWRITSDVGNECIHADEYAVLLQLAATAPADGGAPEHIGLLALMREVAACAWRLRGHRERLFQLLDDHRARIPPPWPPGPSMKPDDGYVE
jgi:hypothetical protein